MATYVLPQVLVFQDFTIATTAAANPMSAHISGGHAQLIRYSDADERDDGLLGYYSDTVNTSYVWPNRTAGAIVDQTYTKLWIKDALLQYYTDAASAGDPVTVTTGYNNRISAAATNFTTNGTYARAATLYDRDVTVGDVIRVRGVPGGGGDPVVLWTYVKAVIADEVAATVAAATADGSNAGTQVQSESISQTAGADNCVTSTADGAAYDGVTDGYISETYTITVIDSSVGGDMTTATLGVLSASGTDDVASVTPAANGAATTIGTRGLTVTFTDEDTAACSLSSDHDGYGYNDLVAGQVFTCTANQAWTEPVATSGGSYSGINNTTYIVEVTRGGEYADLVKPQISVTTTNGVDQSGPTEVTAAASSVSIGSDLVTLSFSGSGLVLGDKYYTVITGVGSGPTRTLELGNNLNTTLTAGDECGIELYIRNPLLEVESNRAGFAPLTNWDQSETEITLNSGIIAYDSTWTDDGVLLALDVHSSADAGYGKAYVEYRAWLSTLCYEINSITDVGDIDDIAGSLTPDNPLKWGVYKALTNSNGTPVLYTSVCDPTDADDWDEVLELAQSRDDVYGMVPLTRDATVLGLFQAHVGAMSAATEALWRVAWFNLAGVPKIPLVSAGSTVPGHTTATTSDGGEALAVFEDDSQTSGNQYTIVRNAAGNAKFITNGVRPGDLVRSLYVSDGFGNYTYSEYVVDEVQSEEQIRLKTGPATPQAVAAKIEVWRNLTLTEESQEVAKDGGAYNDRRIRAIWPDQIETSGTIQEGYHLAAALSGLSSGVVPQQGMTRLAVAGFTDVQRTARFSKDQLDTLAIAGVWIVMQNPDGDIFTRQAVTTGSYSDINQREEMLTRNVDSISYRYKDYFEPYIGVTNVTPSMEDVIKAGLTILRNTLQTERATENLGGQLIDAEVVSFEASEIFKDRYVAFIELTVPYAMNNLELHLIV
jgi:hypothetical protein